MPNEYNDEFYDDLERTQIPSAKAIAPFLYELFKPTSAVDVGCGRGFWLQEFSKLGTQRVFGVDGPWISPDKLAFSAQNFKECDLSKEIVLNETFDLAINLEVAEHLPEERAESFVQDICKLAPAVFLGAAIPGQGGVNHYNEQWPSYWAELFEANGYLAYDLVRPLVWRNEEVAWWYKQNAIVYVKKEIAEKNSMLAEHSSTPAKNVAALVHPQLFKQKLKEAEPGFGRWFRGGKKALIRSLNK
ncbi:class I SAM-dependent methyltransferase [Kiloniella litopenaei]|uniref:class I SAM-dependent methyltransferase n=1 Tax=Kiloniella litopenaei TaxID=1549748 RepID=UPI003BAA7727